MGLFEGNNPAGPNPYDEGRFQALRLESRSTRRLKSTLIYAREGRTRLINRLFRRPKCRFYEGFINGLEAELARRAASGDAEAVLPVTTPGSRFERWSTRVVNRPALLRRVLPGLLAPRGRAGLPDPATFEPDGGSHG